MHLAITHFIADITQPIMQAATVQVLTIIQITVDIRVLVIIPKMIKRNGGSLKIFLNKKF